MIRPAVTLALLITALVGSETPREQPLLLPMPDLLRSLDPSEEWLVLPLDEYRALIAAGADPTTKAQPAPTGAWLESASVTGILEDDRRLRLHAELVAVAAADGAARCHLLHSMPERLGAATVDGAPALWERRPDGGIDVILPGPGRHQVVVTWGIDLSDQADARRGGILPLPCSTGLTVTLHTGPGMLGSEWFAPVGDDAWTLVRPVSSSLAITWRPGRAGDDGNAVWGVDQSVEVLLTSDPDAPLAWHWTAQPEARRGRLPADVMLRLPAGWTTTRSGAGILAVSPLADGTVLLRIDPAAATWELSGFAPVGTALALPSLTGATWQGGTVTLRGDSGRDWIPPARWRPLPGDAGRVYRVPGPDAGLRPVIARLAAASLATTTSALAIGPERWRLESRLTVDAGAERYALDLALPLGWTPRSLACSLPARLDGVALGSAELDAPVDGVLHLTLPEGTGGADRITVDLVLERPAQATLDLAVPTVIAADRHQHRLAIAAAPGLEVGIAAADWRRAGQLAIPATAAGAALRAVLDGSGAVRPVQLTVAAKPATCDAEIVAWLLPLDDPSNAGVWCRLDCRLTVADGDIEALAVTLPFIPGSERLGDPTLFLERSDSGLTLSAHRPWRGERLVRIEGRLAGGSEALIGFPRPAFARLDGGTAIPTRLQVVVQAPQRLDLRLVPGADARPLDLDDLPRWTRSIPGDPVMGAWLLAGPDVGGFQLVSRPLAEAPRGFIHEADVRTQISSDRLRTLLRFRLGAPGLAALPLGLPAGQTLVSATVDGHPVAVRKVGDDAVLPLPGRTQVAIALLIDAPLTGDISDLPLPSLDGIPIVDLTWTVGIDGLRRVRVLAGPDAMPLAACGSTQRRWFSTWRSTPTQVEALGLLASNIAPEESDPRRLPIPSVPTTTDEPGLTLIGQIWTGQRLGGDVHLRLAWQGLDQARRADRLGLALAILLGAWLAWRSLPTALLAAAGAFATAFALHLADTDFGPLLACAEWTAPVTIVLILLRWIRRVLTPRTPVTGALP